MSKAKKVIFVIVEGPTDEDALSSVLKQIFSSAEVHFHVIHVGHKEIKRRERVYAYELYHQMRLIQEQKFKSEFTINGEIDKSGHKIIKEPFNPDFVIHQQGKMGENFCVVELKTINKKSGIQKDFHTITCMMHCYRYKIGIFAIAGVLLSDIKSILVEVWNTQEHLQEHGEKIYVIAQDDNGKLCAKSMANIIHSV